MSVSGIARILNGHRSEAWLGTKDVDKHSVVAGKHQSAMFPCIILVVLQVSFHYQMEIKQR